MSGEKLGNIKLKIAGEKLKNIPKKYWVYGGLVATTLGAGTGITLWAMNDENTYETGNILQSTKATQQELFLLLGQRILEIAGAEHPQLLDGSTLQKVYIDDFIDSRKLIFVYGVPSSVGQFNDFDPVAMALSPAEQREEDLQRSYVDNAILQRGLEQSQSNYQETHRIIYDLDLEEVVAVISKGQSLTVPTELNNPAETYDDFSIAKALVKIHFVMELVDNFEINHDTAATTLPFKSTGPGSPGLFELSGDVNNPLSLGDIGYVSFLTIPEGVEISVYKDAGSKELTINIGTNDDFFGIGIPSISQDFDMTFKRFKAPSQLSVFVDNEQRNLNTFLQSLQPQQITRLVEILPGKNWQVLDDTTKDELGELGFFLDSYVPSQLLNFSYRFRFFNANDQVDIEDNVLINSLPLEWNGDIRVEMQAGLPADQSTIIWSENVGSWIDNVVGIDQTKIAIEQERISNLGLTGQRYIDASSFSGENDILDNIILADWNISGLTLDDANYEYDYNINSISADGQYDFRIVVTRGQAPLTAAPTIIPVDVQGPELALERENLASEQVRVNNFLAAANLILFWDNLELLGESETRLTQGLLNQYQLTNLVLDPQYFYYITLDPTIASGDVDVSIRVRKISDFSYEVPGVTSPTEDLNNNGSLDKLVIENETPNQETISVIGIDESRAAKAEQERVNALSVNANIYEISVSEKTDEILTPALLSFYNISSTGFDFVNFNYVFSHALMDTNGNYDFTIKVTSIPVSGQNITTRATASPFTMAVQGIDEIREMLTMQQIINALATNSYNLYWSQLEFAAQSLYDVDRTQLTQTLADLGINEDLEAAANGAGLDYSTMDFHLEIPQGLSDDGTLNVILSIDKLQLTNPVAPIAIPVSVAGITMAKRIDAAQTQINNLVINSNNIVEFYQEQVDLVTRVPLTQALADQLRLGINLDTGVNYFVSFNRILTANGNEDVLIEVEGPNVGDTYTLTPVKKVIFISGISEIKELKAEQLRVNTFVTSARIDGLRFLEETINEPLTDARKILLALADDDTNNPGTAVDVPGLGFNEDQGYSYTISYPQTEENIELPVTIIVSRPQLVNTNLNIPNLVPPAASDGAVKVQLSGLGDLTSVIDENVRLEQLSAAWVVPTINKYQTAITAVSNWADLDATILADLGLDSYDIVQIFENPTFSEHIGFLYDYQVTGLSADGQITFTVRPYRFAYGDDIYWEDSPGQLHPPIVFTANIVGITATNNLATEQTAINALSPDDVYVDASSLAAQNNLVLSAGNVANFGLDVSDFDFANYNYLLTSPALSADGNLLYSIVVEDGTNPQAVTKTVTPTSFTIGVTGIDAYNNLAAAQQAVTALVNNSRADTDHRETSLPQVTDAPLTSAINTKFALGITLDPNYIYTYSTGAELVNDGDVLLTVKVAAPVAPGGQTVTQSVTPSVFDISVVGINWAISRERVGGEQTDINAIAVTSQTASNRDSDHFTRAVDETILAALGSTGENTLPLISEANAQPLTQTLINAMGLNFSMDSTFIYEYWIEDPNNQTATELTADGEIDVFVKVYGTALGGGGKDVTLIGDPPEPFTVDVVGIDAILDRQALAALQQQINAAATASITTPININVNDHPTYANLETIDKVTTTNEKLTQAISTALGLSITLVNDNVDANGYAYTYRLWGAGITDLTEDATLFVTVNVNKTNVLATEAPTAYHVVVAGLDRNEVQNDVNDEQDIVNALSASRFVNASSYGALSNHVMSQQDFDDWNIAYTMLSGFTYTLSHGAATDNSDLGLTIVVTKELPAKPGFRPSPETISPTGTHVPTAIQATITGIEEVNALSAIQTAINTAAAAPTTDINVEITNAVVAVPELTPAPLTPALLTTYGLDTVMGLTTGYTYLYSLVPGLTDNGAVSIKVTAQQGQVAQEVTPVAFTVNITQITEEKEREALAVIQQDINDQAVTSQSASTGFTYDYAGRQLARATDEDLTQGLANDMGLNITLQSGYTYTYSHLPIGANGELTVTVIAHALHSTTSTAVRETLAPEDFTINVIGINQSKLNYIQTTLNNYQVPTSATNPALIDVDIFTRDLQGALTTTLLPTIGDVHIPEVAVWTDIDNAKLTELGLLSSISSTALSFDGYVLQYKIGEIVDDGQTTIDLRVIPDPNLTGTASTAPDGSTTVTATSPTPVDIFLEGIDDAQARYLLCSEQQRIEQLDFTEDTNNSGVLIPAVGGVRLSESEFEVLNDVPLDQTFATRFQIDLSALSLDSNYEYTISTEAMNADGTYQFTITVAGTRDVFDGQNTITVPLVQNLTPVAFDYEALGIDNAIFIEQVDSVISGLSVFTLQAPATTSIFSETGQDLPLIAPLAIADGDLPDSNDYAQATLLTKVIAKQLGLANLLQTPVDENGNNIYYTIDNSSGQNVYEIADQNDPGAILLDSIFQTRAQYELFYSLEKVDQTGTVIPGLTADANGLFKLTVYEINSGASQGQQVPAFVSSAFVQINGIDESKATYDLTNRQTTINALAPTAGAPLQGQTNLPLVNALPAGTELTPAIITQFGITGITLVTDNVDANGYEYTIESPEMGADGVYVIKITVTKPGVANSLQWDEITYVGDGSPSDPDVTVPRNIDRPAPTDIHVDMDGIDAAIAAQNHDGEQTRVNDLDNDGLVKNWYVDDITLPIGTDVTIYDQSGTNNIDRISELGLSITPEAGFVYKASYPALSADGDLEVTVTVYNMGNAAPTVTATPITISVSGIDAANALKDEQERINGDAQAGTFNADVRELSIEVVDHSPTIHNTLTQALNVKYGLNIVMNPIYTYEYEIPTRLTANGNLVIKVYVLKAGITQRATVDFATFNVTITGVSETNALKAEQERVNDYMDGVTASVTIDKPIINEIVHSNDPNQPDHYPLTPALITELGIVDDQNVELVLDPIYSYEYSLSELTADGPITITIFVERGGYTQYATAASFTRSVIGVTSAKALQDRQAEIETLSATPINQRFNVAQIPTITKASATLLTKGQAEWLGFDISAAGLNFAPGALDSETTTAGGYQYQYWYAGVSDDTDTLLVNILVLKTNQNPYTESTFTINPTGLTAVDELNALQTLVNTMGTNTVGSATPDEYFWPQDTFDQVLESAPGTLTKILAEDFGIDTSVTGLNFAPGAPDGETENDDGYTFTYWTDQTLSSDGLVKIYVQVNRVDGSNITILNTDVTPEFFSVKIIGLDDFDDYEALQTTLNDRATNDGPFSAVVNASSLAQVSAFTTLTQDIANDFGLGITLNGDYTYTYKTDTALSANGSVIVTIHATRVVNTVDLSDNSTLPDANFTVAITGIDAVDDLNAEQTRINNLATASQSAPLPYLVNDNALGATNPARALPDALATVLGIVKDAAYTYTYTNDPSGVNANVAFTVFVAKGAITNEITPLDFSVAVSGIDEVNALSTAQTNINSAATTSQTTPLSGSHNSPSLAAANDATLTNALVTEFGLSAALFDFNTYTYTYSHQALATDGQITLTIVAHQSIGSGASAYDVDEQVSAIAFSVNITGIQDAIDVQSDLAAINDQSIPYGARIKMWTSFYSVNDILSTTNVDQIINFFNEGEFDANASLGTTRVYKVTEVQDSYILVEVTTSKNNYSETKVMRINGFDDPVNLDQNQLAQDYSYPKDQIATVVAAGQASVITPVTISSIPIAGYPAIRSSAQAILTQSIVDNLGLGITLNQRVTYTYWHDAITIDGVYDIHVIMYGGTIARTNPTSAVIKTELQNWTDQYNVGQDQIVLDDFSARSQVTTTQYSVGDVLTPDQFDRLVNLYAQTLTSGSSSNLVYDQATLDTFGLQDANPVAGVTRTYTIKEVNDDNLVITVTSEGVVTNYNDDKDITITGFNSVPMGTTPPANDLRFVQEVINDEVTDLAATIATPTTTTFDQTSLPEILQTSPAAFTPAIAASYGLTTLDFSDYVTYTYYMDEITSDGTYLIHIIMIDRASTSLLDATEQDFKVTIGGITDANRVVADQNALASTYNFDWTYGFSTTTSYTAGDILAEADLFNILNTDPNNPIIDSAAGPEVGDLPTENGVTRTYEIVSKTATALVIKITSTAGNSTSSKNITISGFVDYSGADDLLLIDNQNNVHEVFANLYSYDGAFHSTPKTGSDAIETEVQLVWINDYDRDMTIDGTAYTFVRARQNSDAADDIQDVVDLAGQGTVAGPTDLYIEAWAPIVAGDNRELTQPMANQLNLGLIIDADVKYDLTTAGLTQDGNLVLTITMRPRYDASATPVVATLTISVEGISLTKSVIDDIANVPSNLVVTKGGRVEFTTSPFSNGDTVDEDLLLRIVSADESDYTSRVNLPEALPISGQTITRTFTVNQVTDTQITMVMVSNSGATTRRKTITLAGFTEALEPSTILADIDQRYYTTEQTIDEESSYLQTSDRIDEIKTDIINFRDSLPNTVINWDKIADALFLTGEAFNWDLKLMQGSIYFYPNGHIQFMSSPMFIYYSAGQLVDSNNGPIVVLDNLEGWGTYYNNTADNQARSMIDVIYADNQWTTKPVRLTIEEFNTVFASNNSFVFRYIEGSNVTNQLTTGTWEDYANTVKAILRKILLPFAPLTTEPQHVYSVDGQTYYADPTIADSDYAYLSELTTIMDDRFSQTTSTPLSAEIFQPSLPEVLEADNKRFDYAVAYRFGFDDFPFSELRDYTYSMGQVTQDGQATIHIKAPARADANDIYEGDFVVNITGIDDYNSLQNAFDDLSATMAIDDHSLSHYWSVSASNISQDYKFRYMFNGTLDAPDTNVTRTWSRQSLIGNEAVYYVTVTLGTHTMHKFVTVTGWKNNDEVRPFSDIPNIETGGGRIFDNAHYFYNGAWRSAATWLTEYNTRYNTARNTAEALTGQMGIFVVELQNLMNHVNNNPFEAKRFLAASASNELTMWSYFGDGAIFDHSARPRVTFVASSDNFRYNNNLYNSLVAIGTSANAADWGQASWGIKWIELNAARITNLIQGGGARIRFHGMKSSGAYFNVDIPSGNGRLDSAKAVLEWIVQAQNTTATANVPNVLTTVYMSSGGTHLYAPHVNYFGPAPAPLPDAAPLSSPAPTNDFAKLKVMHKNQQIIHALSNENQQSLSIIEPLEDIYE